MKRHVLRTALCVLLAAVVLTALAYLSGGAGSQSDPLVSLSYLTDTFTGQILEKVDKLLETRSAALRQELEQEITQAEQRLQGQLGGTQAPSGGGAAFAAVTLTAGQTLHGEAGCELILRSGGATAGAQGLVDATSGGSLGGGGPLQSNHLYLMPEARSVQAGGTGAALLVRGSYTLG